MKDINQKRRVLPPGVNLTIKERTGFRCEACGEDDSVVYATATGTIEEILEVCEKCRTVFESDIYEGEVEEAPVIEEVEPIVWTVFDLTTLEGGRIAIEMRTNDDNDDGCPDDDIVRSYDTVANLESALKVTGGPSHYGHFGHHVSVYLDGKEMKAAEA